ncbi:hypothetical protein BD779DRAFT_1567178 [Infundibulicybe gibba]|nr:hypothetical protein BD779DRAFT_1567178 [Infundibulicybe gibba]
MALYIVLSCLGRAAGQKTGSMRFFEGLMGGPDKNYPFGGPNFQIRIETAQNHPDKNREFQPFLDHGLSRTFRGPVRPHRVKVEI